MPVAWEDADPRFIFWNELGAWSVWKRFTWTGDRTASVGPGYIGRVRALTARSWSTTSTRAA